jgi:16S rRNA (uracil1498-N3)-methyltransferase
MFLSGPEGGLTPEEEAAARAVGFVPATLGARVLRAETAALAALAALAMLA